MIAVAVIATTTHYLSHFHFGASAGAAVPGYEHAHDTGDARERSGLCLQLDRLPALPAALSVPTPTLVLLGAVDRLPTPQRASTALRNLPPARAPARTTFI
jgi:hypothetical protein